MARKKLQTKIKKHQKKIDAAIELFQNFRGDEPRFVDTVHLKVDSVASAIGHLNGVMYETTRNGKREKYIHQFKKGCRPVLAVSSDGKQLYILAGVYTFTDRGIEDK